MFRPILMPERANMKLKEALDLPFGGQYFHPSKKKYVEKLPSHEKEIVTGMYPSLDKENQAYLELITSDSYKRTCDRLAKYLGVSLEELHRQYPSFSSLYSIILSNFFNIIESENLYKEELEILAVETVLDLPEFQAIKEMVNDGLLTIDARIDTPDLTNAITANELKAKPGKLTTAEKDTQNLSKEYTAEDIEVRAKRSFAKTLAQGNAINKFYLFHLVEDKLNEIDPNLVKMYGVLCAGTTMSYYSMPMVEMSRFFVDNAAVGSAEVENENTIKARGANFPILVHEIVKGIYNWLSYDIASQEQLDKETLDSEVLELMSGETIYNNFRKLIDVKDQVLIPFIIKDLLRHPAEVIKTVNAGGSKAQNVMSNLVKRARQAYNEWKNSSNPEEEL